ncbi:hypothetical protein N878_08620 [Pseudomonas sp. EGD-AK9]|nr:hypothetical protein [Pseudomonas sp. EGD-AK9]ERI50511.1 hypothetical protein N878_08620 [Pseudomonas sp. EGD-AK9]
MQSNDDTPHSTALTLLGSALALLLLIAIGNAVPDALLAITH